MGDTLLGKKIYWLFFVSGALCSLLFASSPSIWYLTTWALVQWIPASSRAREVVQARAWEHWEQEWVESYTPQPVPVFNVQQHGHNATKYLEATFGKDWRRRPLLLKGLWTQEELQDPARRLSLQGLLREDLEIPYFTDASLEGALAPDDRGRVRDVVANISTGAPHKIGTQFVVQTYPDLIREVAPTKLVTELFGDYFQPDRVKGLGPGLLLPALTTVPLFVASGNQGDDSSKRPFTGLHCEPIGNVAVQLSGVKEWILVPPEHSWGIRPMTSPDGRAFFASQASDFSHVPVYQARTGAGDALWVPTWTWHRVDYVESDEIAIGGSLFHFRPVDYVRNNPLFAALMVPAIILELVGYNTQ